MRKLRILAVEYITGGGFNTGELPESLAREGLTMLGALIESLQGLSGIELIVMLDSRVAYRLDATPVSYETIGAEQSFEQELTRIIQTCDAVWPIAPESGGILQGLCQIVEYSGKILLNSSAAAVSLAGNKWHTYQRLQKHGITSVETIPLSEFAYSSGEWMIKPVDGAGCELSVIVRTEEEFDNAVRKLNRSSFIVQPHLKGEKISLSALFNKSKSRLLCANRQHFDIVERRYRLTGITVNYTSNLDRYGKLLSEIAYAFPELWGYAGVDLIENQHDNWVLEINPRLTTSFAGINEACGINCAQSVLDLLTGEPAINPNNNRPLYIDLLP